MEDVTTTPGPIAGLFIKTPTRDTNGTRIPPANAPTGRVKTRILAQESNDRYDVHGGLCPGDFGDDLDCFSKLFALFNFPGAFVGATSLT